MFVPSEELAATDNTFDLLVRNALDFLDRAIAEIEESPKYSIINFFSAVELFFKARLMREHWSLVIAKPEHANLKKFRDGDFQSVTLDQSIERLKNIAGENLTDNEVNPFRVLRKHRNQLVHFFHDSSAKNPDVATLEAAVIELCKGWWLLHRLLKGRWGTWFEEYENNFDVLASKVNRLKQFLGAKYEVLKPEIEGEISRGQRYTLCLICGFRAAKVDRTRPPLIQTKCRVCRWQANSLIVKCAQCAAEIDIEDGAGTCGDCNSTVDLDDLLEEFGVQQEGVDPKEQLADEEVHAYCPECEYSDQPTVIPFEDRWLCLNCQSDFATADLCEWCNTFVAGSGSGSGTYLTGCTWCEGMMGYYHDQ